MPSPPEPSSAPATASTTTSSITTSAPACAPASRPPPSFTSPDGRLPAFYWDDGFPDNYAKAPFFSPSGQNKQAIDYIATDTKPPYIQSWNIGLEHQFTSSFKLEASYVANKGTRLNRIFAMMQTKPDDLRLGDLLTKRIDDPAVVAAGFRSPYPHLHSGLGRRRHPLALAAPLPPIQLH